MDMGIQNAKKEKKQESNVLPFSVLLSDADKTKEIRIKQVSKFLQF